MMFKIYLPMQPGDVEATSSDISLLEEWINFKPNTSIKEGINKFIKWFKAWFKYYLFNFSRFIG